MLKTLVEEAPLGGLLAIIFLYIGYLLLNWGWQDPVQCSFLANRGQRLTLTHVLDEEGDIAI